MKKNREQIIKEVTNRPFTRDPSKMQYKQVYGEKFLVLCECNYGKSLATHPNFFKDSFHMLGNGGIKYTGGLCPVCDNYSGIDLTPKESL